MNSDRKVLLLGIVALLAFLKFAIQPLNAVVDELEAELQDNLQKLDRREQSIEEVQALKQQEGVLDIRLNELKGQFSTGPDNEIMQLMFQKKLETEARKNDVTLTSIEWGKIVDGAPVSAELEVKYEAPFKNLMAFHSNIANAGFSVVTDELYSNVVQQNIGWKRLGQAKGTLKLRIFYLVENG